MTPIYQARGKEYDRNNLKRKITSSLFTYPFFTRGTTKAGIKKQTWVFDEKLYNFTIAKKIGSTRQPQKDNRCRVNKRQQPQEISNDLELPGKVATNIDDSIINKETSGSLPVISSDGADRLQAFYMHIADLFKRAGKPLTAAIPAYR